MICYDQEKMMIPEDLKFFSFIYECRAWVLTPLLVAWLLGAFYFLCRRKKIFFLWLLLFPLGIQLPNLGATYCGWRYRMELRDRFARAPVGWTDSFSSRPINLDLMPPEIRAEYAKHNYHPRFRDLKAQIVGMIVFTPFLYLTGGGLFLLVSLGYFPKRGENP